jgi:hypothetical protein
VGSTANSALTRAGRDGGHVARPASGAGTTGTPSFPQDVATLGVPTFPMGPFGASSGARAGPTAAHGGTPLTVTAPDAALAAMVVAGLALARILGRGILLDERAARPA